MVGYVWICYVLQKVYILSPTPLQAQNLKVCALDENLAQKLKKFRFRKATTNAAIISKSLCSQPKCENLRTRCLCYSEDRYRKYDSD